MRNSTKRTGRPQKSTANHPSTARQTPAGTTSEQGQTALDEPEGADAPSDGEEAFGVAVAGLQIHGTSSGNQQRPVSDGGDTTTQAPEPFVKKYPPFTVEEGIISSDETIDGVLINPQDEATASVSLSAQQQDQLADILKHLSHQQRTLAQIQAYLADKDNQTVIETIAQSGVRSALPRILEGTLVVAGVSTVTLLTIGGLAPLLIPAATGTLTTTIAFGWLTNIGSNVLASWIQGWAEKQVGKLFSRDATKYTQELAQAIGPELEADMRKDRSLAKALANMLEKLDIRRI